MNRGSTVVQRWLSGGLTVAQPNLNGGATNQLPITNNQNIPFRSSSLELLSSSFSLGQKTVKNDREKGGQE